MKLHLKNHDCGTPYDATIIHTTEDKNKVTCKRCLKHIQDLSLPRKNYIVFWDNREVVVETINSQKAIYKAFEKFAYNDDYPKDEEFNRFLNCKPKAKICKDREVTLTDEELYKLKQEASKAECREWNINNPIGSKVLFQADGEEICKIAIIEHPAKVYATYLVVWLEGVSGSYHLSDEFIRPLKGNECLLGKSLR